MTYAEKLAEIMARSDLPPTKWVEVPRALTVAELAELREFIRSQETPTPTKPNTAKKQRGMG